jgi:hypothetical protein
METGGGRWGWLSGRAAAKALAYGTSESWTTMVVCSVDVPAPPAVEERLERQRELERAFAVALAPARELHVRAGEADEVGSATFAVVSQTG